MSVPSGPRECPDCGSPRLVGYDTETGAPAWSCVSMNCPPTRLVMEGRLRKMAGDMDVFSVGNASINPELERFIGKRVLITLSVFGEPNEEDVVSYIEIVPE